MSILYPALQLYWPDNDSLRVCFPLQGTLLFVLFINLCKTPGEGGSLIHVAVQSDNFAEDEHINIFAEVDLLDHVSVGYHFVQPL